MIAIQEGCAVFNGQNKLQFSKVRHFVSVLEKWIILHRKCEILNILPTGSYGYQKMYRKIKQKNIAAFFSAKSSKVSG